MSLLIFPMYTHFMSHLTNKPEFSAKYAIPIIMLVGGIIVIAFLTITPIEYVESTV